MAGAGDILPKFTLGAETPIHHANEPPTPSSIPATSHTVVNAPGIHFSPNQGIPRPYSETIGGAAGAHDLRSTPTQTRAQSISAPAGASGVWTPQGYVKPNVYTPSTTAASAADTTAMNMQTPVGPYGVRPRNSAVANSQSSLFGSRYPRDPRMVQNNNNNPSAYLLPPRHRTDPSHSQSAGEMARVPSLLRSILNQENIDYENDFYWMQQFRLEKERDPRALEQSLAQSMLYSQTSLNPHSLIQRYGNGSNNRNSFPPSRRANPYDSRLGGLASGHSDLDLDLSLNALGDHPVPSFTDTSQFSQLQTQAGHLQNQESQRVQMQTPRSDENYDVDTSQKVSL